MKDPVPQNLLYIEPPTVRPGVTLPEHRATREHPSKLVRFWPQHVVAGWFRKEEA